MLGTANPRDSARAKGIIYDKTGRCIGIGGRSGSVGVVPVEASANDAALASTGAYRARLAAWSHAWLVALDQLTFVWLAGWFYLFGRAACPSPYETISSYTGRMANAGMRWALIAQAMIDRLFKALGSPPGHCQRSIVRADLQLPLP